MALRIGKPGALFLWVGLRLPRLPARSLLMSEISPEFRVPDSVLCLSDSITGLLAYGVCIQSRSWCVDFRGDNPISFGGIHDCYLALPDRGYFGQVTPWTKTPLRAVWFTTFFSVLPGLLDLASPIAAQAIFALCAIALDSSYIIPIILCVRPFDSRNKSSDLHTTRD